MDRKLYLLFALLNLLGIVSAQPENCYFCNSEVHGVACHDPVDRNLIQTQRCSDFETEPSQSYYSEILDFFHRHNVFIQETGPAVRNTTIPNVCFSMTYEFNSRNVTARGCEEEQKYSNNVDLVNVCDYYNGRTPGRITNLNCSTCTGNLCNVRGNDSNQVLPFKFLLVIILIKVVF